MKYLILTIFTVFTQCSVAAEKTEITASEVLSLIKSGKHVEISNKIIIGDLDFTLATEPFTITGFTSQSEIGVNIYFRDCLFMGKVTSNSKRAGASPAPTAPARETSVQTSFKNNLTFVACDFRSEVNFDHAVVFGIVNFSGSVFRENTSFNNIAVWSKECRFNEIKAEKRFMMVYSTILGNLNFFDAEFSAVASFQETTVMGNLVFNNVKFSQRVGFDLMAVYASAFFNYSQFAAAADFSRARFQHTVEFANAKFATTANFEKTSFGNEVNFDGVDKERINFKDAFFAIPEK